MKYELLIPTHNRLRSIESFNYFVERFKYTKEFTNRTKLITVVFTEDGKHYIWDGTHELAAAYYSNVPLDESKIRIKYFTYKALNTINFSCGFVTPFDPRTHSRLPNFMVYKEIAIELNKEKGYNVAEQFIKENPKMYREKRTSSNIKELLYASGIR